MSESPRISGETFASERLRDNPQLTFETLRQVAEQAGVTIQPIQYGRARRQLGLTGAPPAASPLVSGSPVSSPPVSGSREAASAGSSSADTIAAEPMEEVSQAPEPVVIPQPVAPPLAGTANATPKRKGSPAFDFLVQSLREEPTLSYGELQTRSLAKDYKIAPIMYGRAKALLGLVPVAPRGQGKNRKANKLATRQTLKQAAASSTDQFGEQLARVRNVDDLVQIIKHLDSERRSLRSLLESIASTIDEALDNSNEAAS